jgi:DNA topoisomerase-3
MAKALIIAEKPSVAADIARVLGGFTRQGEHYEHDQFVLSSAVGHLVEIAAPEEFEVKRGKWSFNNLPVIPSYFDLRPIARNEDRLKMLAKLIKRKDVDVLINACDAGREGELIFQQIARFAKAKQPVRRLWLQSMTPAAIRQGFASLQDDKTELSAAAQCRSEADWLVGINGTRAMTAFNSRDGGFFLTTVGRVQTPTLAIVVSREEQIRRFISRDYWEVRARFGAVAGQYDGKWFERTFRKSETDEHARADRLWDRARAEAIVAECTGQPGTVVDESKPTSQWSGALYDLTTLQREANSRFGFSAKTTLSIAQALYEKHKVLTYPRTDSRHLPEDYLPTVGEVMQSMVDAAGLPERSAGASLGPFAQQALAQGWIKPSKRVFDNAKISDHFAIIPTAQAPRTLSEAEQKVYDLVARRFLAVFFPPAEYLVTTRTTTVAGHHFRTTGKVLKSPGWLAIYGREAQEDDATLVAVQDQESVALDRIESVGLKTQPPARYNEGTLLSAMENAGDAVDDELFAAAMSEKGLGTPATRAAIIEGLLNEQYLLREGRELQPTAKAFQLLTLLRGLGVQELTKPELTGQWEHKLKLIEQGKMDRDVFMREISAMTERIVQRAKSYESDTVPGDYATLAAPCPQCGGVVRENYRRFACTACEFSISKNPGSRSFEIPEVEQLLRDHTLGPLQGFRSKIGRPFAAILKLTPDHKLEFDFGQGAAGDRDEGGEPEDFSDRTSLGPCPKCQARVFEKGLHYVCEHSVGTLRSCDFRSGKIILQQEISNEQMRKLLADGRTDSLADFVSQRTRRKFKAFLVRDTAGKIGFEFAPRPERPGRLAAAARSATPTDKKPAVKPAKTPAKKPVKSVTTKAATIKAPAKATAKKKSTAKATPPNG